jgi:hypothetical protein
VAEACAGKVEEVQVRVRGICRRWLGCAGFGRRGSTTRRSRGGATLLCSARNRWRNRSLSSSTPTASSSRRSRATCTSSSRSANPTPPLQASPRRRIRHKERRGGWMWVFARKTPPASAPCGIRVPVAVGRRGRTTRPLASTPPRRTGRGCRLARRRESRLQDEVGGDLQSLWYTDGFNRRVVRALTKRKTTNNGY